MKATGHTAVKVNLTNGRFLTIAMTNAPFASLPDDARRAKAQAIAQVALDTYPPRASLESVSVAFVKYKVTFFIFTYTDAADAFTFKPADLTPRRPRDGTRPATDGLTPRVRAAARLSTSRQPVGENRPPAFRTFFRGETHRLVPGLRVGTAAPSLDGDLFVGEGLAVQRNPHVVHPEEQRAVLFLVAPMSPAMSLWPSS